jgi:hypothetical protein
MGRPFSYYCDFILSYYSPKLVRIHNYQVGLIYRSIQLLCFALFCFRLLWGHSYLQYDTPMAVVNGRLSALGYCNDANRKTPGYCVNTWLLPEYVYGECEPNTGSADVVDQRTQIAFGEIPCDPCLIDPDSIWTQDSNAFFAATHVRSVVVVDGNPQIQSVYIPNIESYRLSFDSEFTTPPKNDEPFVYDGEATAKVMFADGNEVEFSSDERIQLSIGEWLRAAGVPSLDKENPNANGGCDKNTPTLRTTGIDWCVTCCNLWPAFNSNNFGALPQCLAL